MNEKSEPKLARKQNNGNKGLSITLSPEIIIDFLEGNLDEKKMLDVLIALAHSDSDLVDDWMEISVAYEQSVEKLAENFHWPEYFKFDEWLSELFHTISVFGEKIPELAGFFFEKSFSEYEKKKDSLRFIRELNSRKSGELIVKLLDENEEKDHFEVKVYPYQEGIYFYLVHYDGKSYPNLVDYHEFKNYEKKSFKIPKKDGLNEIVLIASKQSLLQQGNGLKPNERVKLLLNGIVKKFKPQLGSVFGQIFVRKYVIEI